MNNSMNISLLKLKTKVKISCIYARFRLHKCKNRTLSTVERLRSSVVGIVG